MKRLKYGSVLFFSACLLSQFAMAQQGPNSSATDKLEVKFGGFVDTYYGFDFNNPPSIDRNYGVGDYYTTFARNNEFNVNLAYVEAKVTNNDNVRGRLALQVGTSVQSNYAGEPGVGNISGPSPVRNIQEASVGYRLADKLWIDAGIMPSYIGFEGFISRDDWTYTRSLMSDLTPFFQSGVKLSYEFNKLWSAQIDVTNGWTNISETNSNKSVGGQVVFTPNENWSFTDNVFFDQETPLGASQYLNRDFNDFFFTYNATKSLQLAVSYDIGAQERANYSGYATWYGAAIFGKYKLSENDSLTLRGERYSDPEQVIVTVYPGTQTNNGFSAWGASLNYDRNLTRALLWRFEARSLWSSDPIFIKGSGFSDSDFFLVTSLALSF